MENVSSKVWSIGYYVAPDVIKLNPGLWQFVVSNISHERHIDSLIQMTCTELEEMELP